MSLKDLQTIKRGNAKAATLVQGNNAYIGIIELDAGAKVPLHRDATEEYLYVLNGNGTITINGESFVIATGTTVYMPSHAEVSFTNGEATKTRFIQIFAGPEPASKYEDWEPTQFTW